MNDDIDNRWNRADFATERAWAEMDEFLKRCEAEGKPLTAEELECRSKLFIEIQQRCVARAMEIFDRVSSGDPAPHLKIAKE